MNERIIINMTKTPLSFMAKDGTFITIPSSGEIRVETIRIEEPLFTAKDALTNKRVKVNKNTVRALVNLPEKREDTILIVPNMVYNAYAHIRDDIYTIDEPFRQNGATKYAKAIARPSISYFNETMKKLSKILEKIHKEKDEEKRTSLIFEAKILTDKNI